MAKEILVPDIGDFADVDVIDVLVNVGDTISIDDALITLESDKASMDIPSPAGGVVKQLKVAVGDQGLEGRNPVGQLCGDQRGIQHRARIAGHLPGHCEQVVEIAGALAQLRLQPRDPGLGGVVAGPQFLRLGLGTAKLGGNIRAAISGGAALNAEIARVFIGLGVPLVQGYGLTETAPVVSASRSI